MVTLTAHCPHRQSDALLRNGHAPNGKPLSRCQACGRQSREKPTPHVSPQAHREQMLHASSSTQPSAGPHPHLWRLAHDCVPLDQKKVAQLPPLRTTLVAPDPKDTTSPILELEERMAQVCSTKPTTLGWGWRCAESADKWSPGRLGIGAGKTGQRLWQAMAEGYRQGPSFTDFWAAYLAVSPSEQQTAVGKERGATAPVERWNNTLRQRLARFVRMTLSFSKSVLMHEACLLLFLHRSHRERAILLK